MNNVYNSDLDSSLPILKYNSLPIYNQSIQCPLYSSKRNMYPKFLFLIGLFYIIPSLQFVFFQSLDNNVECYYNFKCFQKVGNMKAFNSIISNILYIIYGLVFIITVKLYHKYKLSTEIDLGLITPPYLYYSLGISLIFEGICSATYHMCPTKLNFQFDTTFMFIGGILMFITIYSKRHHEPDPLTIFTFLGVLCFINILPLSGITSEFDHYLWAVTFVFVAYIMINLSIRIYYGKQYIPSLINIKQLFKINKKKYPKLMFLCIINIFTLGTYIWAVITQIDFTDWILGLIVINMLLYFCYYLIQKIIHKEKIQFKIWLWLVIDLIIFALSLVYFINTSYNIFLSPAESKALNKPCIVLEYFDYHDIWHMLSATGLFIFMNIIYFLDSHIDGIIGNNINIF